jgi:hypothetical protein
MNIGTLKKDAQHLLAFAFSKLASDHVLTIANYATANNDIFSLSSHDDIVTFCDSDLITIDIDDDRIVSLFVDKKHNLKKIGFLQDNIYFAVDFETFAITINNEAATKAADAVYTLNYALSKATHEIGKNPPFSKAEQIVNALRAGKNVTSCGNNVIGENLDNEYQTPKLRISLANKASHPADYNEINAAQIVHT